MDCRETQERVLERFDGALDPMQTRQLEAHIAECPECAQFAAFQSQIDLRLREQIAAPQLSVGFRGGLQARIARKARESWPEWLPDVAHLAGCAAAIGACALLLPFSVPLVLGTGTLVALLAYTLQTLLFSALEDRWE